MTTEMAELPTILKIEEVARILRCSKHSVYAEVRAGRLPVIRLSDRVWRISRRALEEFVDGQR
jgi:excisionase family DNA binding protein